MTWVNLRHVLGDSSQEEGGAIGLSEVSLCHTLDSAHPRLWDGHLLLLAASPWDSALGKGRDALEAGLRPPAMDRLWGTGASPGGAEGWHGDEARRWRGGDSCCQACRWAPT